MAAIKIAKAILNQPGARAAGIILGSHVVCTSVTLLTATIVGAPFVPWFKDTFLLLWAVFLHVAIFAIVWDGTLVAIGLASEWLGRIPGLRYHSSVSVASMREKRFLTRGPWPTVLVLLTAFAILGTANVTLISLELLHRNPAWKDPFFWQLEQGIFQWLTRRSIDPQPWDRLYHSAWTVVLLATFVITLIRKETGLLLHYALSMVLLFYVGRFVGLLTPVMGPAFYRPELFGYLHGSISDSALNYIKAMMAIAPAEAAHKSGILIGGVSAMPSLHIAMVAVTSYWLAVGNRKTLFVTVPWVLIVWASTAILGWHYVLDGAGGVLLAAACIPCSHWLLRIVNVGRANDDRNFGRLGG